MFNLTYRPSKFSEFIGNESQIKNLLVSFPDWPSTFLLTGPPGIGKTTLARIIANQLKCEKMNIYEIDAGQDRGIDNVRNLIKGAYNKPLVGKGKIYIIDECQGLTSDAQQALLKITEETPTNTYFVFCSTDPQKIIKALKSRCQQGFINLLPLSNKELGIIIKNICEKENIDLSKIKEIAKECIFTSDGIPRNAIMKFEKYHTYDSIEEVKKEIKGSIEIPENIWEIVNALDENKFEEFLVLFQKEQRGNWESFRIWMGNVFKKKLLKSLINQDRENILKYENILLMFCDPVDNNLGDIQLISRFAMYDSIRTK